VGKIADNGISRNDWMKLRLLHQNQLQLTHPHPFPVMVVFLLMAIVLGMTERNDQEAIDHLLTHLSSADLSPCKQVLQSCFFFIVSEASVLLLSSSP
jgi:hypothetical protein